MAGNFLSDAALSDRFFTLMAFLHLVGLPIFLVFGIWLHEFRLSRPEINPPRRLMAGALMAMLLLSLVFPAQSQDKADLALAPQTLEFDWFYLHVYPLVQAWSPGWVWVLLVAVSSLILLAPWLPPGKVEKPAVVSLDNCNGCRRCADDCPYGAITMATRSDGKNYLHEAVVDADLCVSCGICVGACPTASPFRTRGDLVPGIDLPAQTASNLRDAIGNVSATLAGSGRALAFACRGSRDAKRIAAAGEPLIVVECMGQIPPSYIDYMLSRDHADGVFLAGCTDQGCHYRFGSNWTAQRIGRTRDPQLRKRIDASRIAMNWPDSPDGTVLRRLAEFKAELSNPAAKVET
jgi:ferredoxin/coenzyme F420-reducing hydrogenase delta subunit